MDTDNPIILKHTKNSPTIICAQRKAEKVIPTEDLIIEANKLAFNDDIGTVTNRVTTMIEIQSSPDLSQEEYDELSYRIMCGQHFQQCTIDRAKGIIAKPMPEGWYNRRANVIKDTDTEQEIKEKQFDMGIVADKKPYFMTYVYPHLKKEYDTYTKNADFKCLTMFGLHIEDFCDKQFFTKEEDDFLKYYQTLMPVGSNPCVVNRISWILNSEFNGYLKNINSANTFDYNILKSDTDYSQKSYNEIKKLYKEYLAKVEMFKRKASTERIEDSQIERRKLVDSFKKDCELICTNKDELCNIVLDICYKTENSKQFAWDICGDVFVRNLLLKNNYVLSYPEKNDEGDFDYMGFNFLMKQTNIAEENY